MGHLMGLLERPQEFWAACGAARVGHAVAWLGARGWSWEFMLRPSPAVAGSVGAVGLRRTARRRASFRRTMWALGKGHGWLGFIGGVCSSGPIGRTAKQSEAEWQQLRTLSVGEEAEVADADEAAGHEVEQEAAQETRLPAGS